MVSGCLAILGFLILDPFRYRLGWRPRSAVATDRCGRHQECPSLPLFPSVRRCDRSFWTRGNEGNEVEGTGAGFSCSVVPGSWTAPYGGVGDGRESERFHNGGHVRRPRSA